MIHEARTRDRRAPLPRRENEAALHYATQALVAVALEAADGLAALNLQDDSLFGRLVAAVDVYKRAEVES